jgi:hypothetical protein
LVPLLSELLRQFPQPSIPAVCLDVLELLSVHSGCAIVGFAAGIGELQNICKGSTKHMLPAMI